MDREDEDMKQARLKVDALMRGGRVGGPLGPLLVDLAASIRAVGGCAEALDGLFERLVQSVRAVSSAAHARTADGVVGREESDFENVVDEMDILLAAFREEMGRLKHAGDLAEEYAARDSHEGWREVDLRRIMERAAVLAEGGDAVTPEIDWEMALLPRVRTREVALREVFVSLFRAAFELCSELGRSRVSVGGWVTPAAGEAPGPRAWITVRVGCALGEAASPRRNERTGLTVRGRAAVRRLLARVDEVAEAVEDLGGSVEVERSQDHVWMLLKFRY
jgi:hypothetical protein